MPDVIYKPTEEDFREAIENAERLLSARELLGEAVDELGELTTDAEIIRQCNSLRARVKTELWSTLKDVRGFIDHDFDVEVRMPLKVWQAVKKLDEILEE